MDDGYTTELVAWAYYGLGDWLRTPISEVSWPFFLLIVFVGVRWAVAAPVRDAARDLIVEDDGR